MHLTLLLLSVFCFAAESFVSPSLVVTHGGNASSRSKLNLDLGGILPSTDDTVTAAEAAAAAARGKFYFYFSAGSGAGGIGIAQLPNVFRDANEARATIGTGASKGGPELTGPLIQAYYGSGVSEADLSDVIEKAPSAEFISKRSTSDSYLAKRGYIFKGDFVGQLAAKKCNPFATYVVFDAICGGKGVGVSPVVYDERLASYREGSSSKGVVARLAGDLNGFVTVKAAGFLGLAFCLLVDVGFVAKTYSEGFMQ